MKYTHRLVPSKPNLPPQASFHPGGTRISSPVPSSDGGKSQPSRRRFYRSRQVGARLTPFTRTIRSSGTSPLVEPLHHTAFPTSSSAPPLPHSPRAHFSVPWSDAGPCLRLDVSPLSTAEISIRIHPCEYMLCGFSVKKGQGDLIACAGRGRCDPSSFLGRPYRQHYVTMV